MSSTTEASVAYDREAVAAALGISSDDAGARVLARINEYVALESPSGHASLLNAIGARITSDLAAAGARIETHDAGELGSNYVAHVDGREALPPVVMLAHIDTVHPVGAFGTSGLRIEDGRAYGPGAYDMKGGASLLVEALTLLHERGLSPRRPVRFLVTCDEEIGSHSSRALIERHAREAAAVLVPEPCVPNGGVKTQRKGVVTYRLETTGRAAHAGVDHGVGVSATHELARQMIRVFDLADPSRGTTLNIGMIGAGRATNVIPDTAWASIDVRLAEPSEGERVHAALEALEPFHPEARVVARRTELRPPLVRSPAIVELYHQARAVAAALGFDLGEGGTGGGSDGSIAAAAGAAVLDGLGPQGAGAHTLQEHIVVDDLPLRLALLCGLLDVL